MEAYPTKVRELVLDAYAEGMATAEVASRFKVSPSWARRVKQRFGSGACGRPSGSGSTGRTRRWARAIGSGWRGWSARRPTQRSRN